MQIKAAVAHASDKPFSIETLDLEDPRAGEVLVRVVGVGICHTDVKAWQQIRPVPLPAVFGHEGAGVVEKIGDGVSKVQPGDHVVMTFHSCGQCANCQGGHSAYCELVGVLNFGAKRLDGSTTLASNGKPVSSPFFGQSSFGTYALASERNVVKVPQDVPLEMLGPLGCGIQTGAGAVMNVLQPAAGSSIVIYGAGSVGLSAAMAAAIVGCTTIISVDVLPHRLELATELGATHVIDATHTDPVQAVRQIVPGGTTYSLDTSARPDVFRQAVDSIRIMGECGLIGGMAPGQEVSIEANHLLLGRRVRGIIQGDSTPDVFIPHLIDLYRQGNFPFDRLISEYALDDINTAVADMRSGKAIKPILKVAAEV